jgi:hypothetical protein
VAAFLGLPLFVLVGWVGGRKSSRKNLFRFLGLILVIVGLSFATGCQQGFTPPVAPPASTGFTTGNYLVQVVATDQNGVKYYAVIPVIVNAD